MERAEKKNDRFQVLDLTFYSYILSGKNHFFGNW